MLKTKDRVEKQTENKTGLSTFDRKLTVMAEG